ncbi:hypothetical protein [Methylocystis iwaonis]|uniref:hypothetical protein n=1 Tax=Methylocystis iwaonis TaxID=2885079 RepID=UPI002492D6ED|nr:hypothetical protein [Methylocystis iwaonis]
MSKVTLPHIRERVLANLINVDADLATRAAYWRRMCPTATIEAIFAAAQEVGAAVNVVTPRIGGVKLKSGAHLPAASSRARPLSFRRHCACPIQGRMYGASQRCSKRLGCRPMKASFGGGPKVIAQNAATRYFAREPSVRKLP